MRGGSEREEQSQAREAEIPRERRGCLLINEPGAAWIESQVVRADPRTLGVLRISRVVDGERLLG